MQVPARGRMCLWCGDVANLVAAIDDNKRRNTVIQALRRMTDAARAEATAKVPESHRHRVLAIAGEAAQRCVGREGQACIFGNSGRPVFTHHQSPRCIFCTPGTLETLCDTADGICHIASLMMKQTEAAQDFVFAHRLPEDAHSSVERKMLGLACSKQSSVELVERATHLAYRADWETFLSVRHYTCQEPSDMTQNQYRQAVLQNRAYARWKMGIPAPRHVRGAAVHNDSGLPLPTSSDFAKRLFNWNVNNSWALCFRCDSLIPRGMTEVSLTQDQKMSLPKSQCTNCASPAPIALPLADNVPSELRGLSFEQAQALSPIDIDVGRELRAREGGYRIKMRMMRFRWRAASVTAHIDALPLRERARARAAYEYLQQADASAYSFFDDEHKAFLRRCPNADERQRLRRYEFIESVGLECALWPTMFWETSLTFTHARATQARIVSGAAGNVDDNDEDMAERSTIRKRFCALALGPLLGYADTFEMLQFAYDLVLWSEIGAKRNMARAPLRIMMAGHSASPEYWKAVRFALVDMVRQQGWPLAMITQSVREEMMPYPHWVCDAMKKGCKARGRLPVAETLATTHCLMQTVRGAICGETPPKEQWRSHLLCPADGRVSLGVFNRIEFQDGTRKAATQDYHGSGRVHTHTVLFGSLNDFARLPLTRVLSAAPVANPIVESYCQAVQMDTFTGKSGWPVREEESQWTQEGYFRLHHDAASQQAGRRACFPDVMEAEPLHEDVLVVDDREGFLRAYLAKYAGKMSDSLITDLLSDDALPKHVAMAFVDRYHPCEPEMVLQLFGSKFRQWRLSTASGGKRDFLPPLPDQTPLCQEVQLYMSATWARGYIPLLDFLRKTGTQGQILQWVRNSWTASGKEQSLEAYARDLAPKGEKVVAARTLSWFNDRYYGQWLMLHVPFEDPNDFVNENILSKVPVEHRYFTMATTCQHPVAQRVWASDDAIHTELKIEGNSARYASSVLAMCRANSKLVSDYVAGRLDKAAEAAARAERERALREEFTSGATARQQAQLESLFQIPATSNSKEIRLPITPSFEDEVRAGRKDVEGRVNRGVASEVQTGDVLALSRVRRKVLAVHHFDGFKNMLQSLGFQRAVPGASSLQNAVRTYHSFRHYAALAREHGVIAFELGEVTSVESIIDDAAFPWTPQQRAVNARLDEFLDLAIDAANDPDEQRAETAKERLWEQNKIIALMGPPGSGKTTVQKRLILRNHAKGGRGFYALPNNALASRMRELCGTVIQTGTCHSILGLDETEMYWPSLDFWQLGLIDEVSQLKDYHYQQIVQMFIRAGKCLVLLITGDKWQMSGFGDSRVWHTTAWRNPAVTFRVDVTHMHRCKDERLRAILSELRTCYAGEATMRELRARERVAWFPVGPPTPEGMRKLLAQHPDTHVLVVSRAGAEAVNECAVQGLFPRFPPRDVLPGDVESAPANYEAGNLKQFSALRPSSFPVHIGMKAYITRTLRKDLDYVNGMEVHIVDYSRHTASVRVQTKTGSVFEVTKWADPELNGLSYYPLRIGYASTILRMAGAELPHVTVYLDLPHAAAAAYTALSRVGRLNQIKIGGKITQDHFAPARG